jgi:hypothetical protein
MKQLRMWIVEEDPMGILTDRKFYIDDPAYIPRIGEFVDGDYAGGWVYHIQWNMPAVGGPSIEAKYHTVYVYLKMSKE